MWDGARTPTELHENYMKRFTMADIKEMRSNEAGKGIYDKWVDGCTRREGTLPAELLQHYSFTSLPGGVEPQNVLTEPPEFQENVFDNVRKPNARALDNSLLAGWWSQTPVHSTVYWNYAIIPWIGNTAAHLPFLDGSSPDSQYWSSRVAGAYLTTEAVPYAYPNEANPYPYFFYHRERANRRYLLTAIDGGYSADSLAKKWEFQLRSDFLGTSDLVPLGGAFAKRGTDFWDGQGAMDAWTETSQNGELADADGNGIPDWAEALGYTTADAYLHALHEGLLPNGTFLEAYCDVADVNSNGLPDWWERLYGLSGVSITDDSDLDGLSVAAEYEKDLDPTMAATDGEILDYFRRETNGWYYGEILADHDFMEDGWEDRFSPDAISRYVYDAHKDSDLDGWSNFAEARAGTDPTAVSTLSIGAEEIAAYPMPVIEADVSLADGATIDGTVVIQAWSSPTLQGRPDATWRVAAGSGQNIANDRLIGMNPLKTVKLQLGPGSVIPDSVKVKFCDPATQSETYNVASNGVKTLVSSLSTGTGPWAKMIKDAAHPDNLGIGDIVWQGDASVLGSIDYSTGEMVLDLAKTKGSKWRTWYDEAHCDVTALERSYVRIEWSSKLLSASGVKRLYLTEPSEGYLREGRNTFVAYLGTVGSAPFGMIKDVDVGWNRVVGLKISLTSNSAVMPRTSMPTWYDGETPVRITRTSINGEATGNRVVFKRNIDLEGRGYISEGDIVRAGRFDLDWATLVRDAETIGIRADDISEVGYTVSIGEGNSSYNVQSFTKEFPSDRLPPVAVRPSVTSAPRILSARPEFVWTGDEGYTAFVLEIATNASPDAVVWSSGTNLLPTVTEEGFVYRAPAFVGRDLEDGTTYFWRVAMLNAKWPTVDASAWSDWANFETAVDSTGRNTGYGQLSVDVRYYGAADSDKGDVIVAAYATPDFTGVPEASLRLPEGDLADLAITNNQAGFTAACTNNLVTFDGLKPGGYYVMAFVDRNGNGKRDSFETWGYANLVGQGVESMYDPVSFDVSATTLEVPAAVVFMEDTDINQNGTPDCGEELELLKRAAATSEREDESEGWGDWAGGFDLDVASDAAFAAAGDVMAYATTNVWFVTLDDGTKFLVMPGSTRRPQVGDVATDYSGSLWTTYRYGWGTEYVYGVGSNATAKAGALIQSVSDVEAALVHAQVYEFFGFDPTTANPTVMNPGDVT